MKRLGGVWSQITTFQNLYKAYKKARKGKGSRPDVALFALNLEAELLSLQTELENGTWQPGGYRHFEIYERKPRLISVAPFRDRVVHHALLNVLEEPLNKRMIDDSYACRKERGVHAAVNRYQAYAQQYEYVLKLDIRRYFPSIDHQILYGQLEHRIKDKQVLNVLKKIIESSSAQGADGFFAGDDLFTQQNRPQGIPIGNLTSQWFSNIYLDAFDHWVKESLKVPAYLRYADDLILLSHSKQDLWRYKQQIGDYLGQELRLHLHTTKAQVSQTATKVDVLGYQVSRTRRWLRADNGFAFKRKLVKMVRPRSRGEITWAIMNASVNSWIGHALHGETLGLRKAIFSEVSLVG